MKNLSESLKWWLENQGKFTNGCLATGEGKIVSYDGNIESIKGDGNFKIIKWDVDIPKPNDTQIQSIISDYEVYLVNKEQSKQSRKQAILSRLGITEEELKDLI